MNAAPVYPILNRGPRSGLVFLRNATGDYFRAYDVPAVVAPVGLKYRTFTLNQGAGNANRVVFIPGDFDGNAVLKTRPYGTLSRETRNSVATRNPRELLSWERPFTLSIWTPPVAGQTEDEGAAVNLVEDLLEQVVRAIQSAADPDGNDKSVPGSVVWGDVRIVSPPNEASFGVELLVSASQLGPLFDITYETVQATPFIPR